MITNPTRLRKLTRIAQPRGMKRESILTGKEMTRASANPPSSMSGTLGEYHMRRTRAITPAKRRTVRVRFVIQIGVGEVSVCSEPTRPADLFSCLMLCFPDSRSFLYGFFSIIITTLVPVDVEFDVEPPLREAPP